MIHCVIKTNEHKVCSYTILLSVTHINEYEVCSYTILLGVTRTNNTIFCSYTSLLGVTQTNELRVCSYTSKLEVTQTNEHKRPMCHITYKRKHFKSINTYNYIIKLITRRNRMCLGNTNATDNGQFKIWSRVTRTNTLIPVQRILYHSLFKYYWQA